MWYQVVLTAIAASFTSVEAKAIPSTATNNVALSCQAVSSPSVTCAVTGVMHNPKTLRTLPDVPTLQSCAAACTVNPNCLVFGYDGSNCTLTSKLFKKQIFQALPDSPTTYYNRNCFNCVTVEGITTSSESTSPSPISTSFLSTSSPGGGASQAPSSTGSSTSSLSGSSSTASASTMSVTSSSALGLMTSSSGTLAIPSGSSSSSAPADASTATVTTPQTSSVSSSSTPLSPSQIAALADASDGPAFCTSYISYVAPVSTLSTTSTAIVTLNTTTTSTSTLELQTTITSVVKTTQPVAKRDVRTTPSAATGWSPEQLSSVCSLIANGTATSTELFVTTSTIISTTTAVSHTTIITATMSTTVTVNYPAVPHRTTTSYTTGCWTGASTYTAFLSVATDAQWVNVTDEVYIPYRFPVSDCVNGAVDQGYTYNCNTDCNNGPLGVFYGGANSLSACVDLCVSRGHAESSTVNGISFDHCTGGCNCWGAYNTDTRLPGYSPNMACAWNP